MQNLRNRYGEVNGVKYWLPSEHQIGGNVHCNYPNTAIIRRAIHEYLGIVDALEPDYYEGGNIVNISDLYTARIIQYLEEEKIKCNGIVAKRDFLKNNNFGMYCRNSDALSCAIITDDEIYMLNITAEALNNGIMRNIPKLPNARAVLGPCIAQSNYSLAGEKLKRISNYKALGYNFYCEKNGEKVNVDIKGIVIFELLRKKIEIEYCDERDTFSCEELGSHRRGDTMRANPLYVWI